MLSRENTAYFAMRLVLTTIIILGLGFSISTQAAITDDINQKNQQI